MSPPIPSNAALSPRDIAKEPALTSAPDRVQENEDGTARHGPGTLVSVKAFRTGPNPPG